MEIHAALQSALEAVAAVIGTDLVLTIGSRPMIRLDGLIHEVDNQPVVDESLMDQYLNDLLDPDQRADMERNRDEDFAFSYGEYRFRGNAFYQRGLPAVSLRLIQSTIPTFDEIGLPWSVRDLTTLKQGLILFCGPTGSGKSTTMAAMIDAINDHRPCHILTIEDPIEYLHKNKVAVVHQREVGIDAQSFERALRAALREDPDIVLVGEMRDPESIAITLTLAETGHLVFSSLHTNDASQTLDRIVDVFPADRQGLIRQQLSSTMSAVVAQRLVPRVGAGLIAAYEVLLGTQPVSNLIREGKSNQLRNAMQIALAAGHKTMETSLNELQAAGIITHESALATAFVPHEITGGNVVSPMMAQA
jgi:twitching motility protein PilT